MFKKFFTAFFLFLFSFFLQTASAENITPISKAIANTDLNRDSVISVTVKNNSTGDIIYSKHSNMFLNPASTLKVFTMAAALDTLGKNYHFETILYLDNDKNLYLKLGGDPMFSSADLAVLVEKLKVAYKGKIKNFYIDDSIIAKNYYPEGWTADDYWPNAAQISPYIIDKNIIPVDFAVVENKGGSYIKITQSDSYQFTFINELKAGNTTNISPAFNYGVDSGIITLTGTVSGSAKKYYPVLNPGQFFTARLRAALDKGGVCYTKPFYQKKVPQNAKRIASFRRPIGEVLKFILYTSNNYAAETVFNVAASVKTGTSGTFENGRKIFYEYYEKAGLDMNKVKIADASGVSRYNTLSTLWMANALYYLNSNSDIKAYLAAPGQGTVSRRMRGLENNALVKTGTIFGVSSLAGYVTSLCGENYSFGIIIQNFGMRPSVLKGLEDDIVNGIYLVK